MNIRRSTATLAVILLATIAINPARAASHREAPLMALDPAADISDVYAFVSYDAENLDRPPDTRRVTLVMNVFPGQEPGSGPNYFAFDDLVRYQIGVDNDRDGEAEDVVYQFRFETEVQSPEQFLATLGGIEPFLPAVTAPDGPGAAGLARIQRYTVTELVGCKRSKDGFHKCKRKTRLFDGALLPTVPSRIGPRTMPDYEDLAAQGIFTDPETGIRVFAGQRAETFAIDLGAVFDTVNLRVEAATPIPGARPPLPIQTAAEDATDTANPFGVNNFSGFNVNTIAIEIPSERLTRDRRPPTAHTGTVGVSATTLRQEETERRGEPGIRASKGQPRFLIRGDDEFVQVSRMGNPLVNELLIPIGSKDFWNAVDPDDEFLFLKSYRTPAVAAALALVSGVPVPSTPREDLVLLLLKYAGQDPDPGRGPFADLLRLDMTIPPTPPAAIKRLGPFAHDADGNATPDPAGFPNGRRPNDDVTDIVVRAAGGQNYIDNYVGDGVGIAETGITTEFPFLPTPFDGRNRRHRDPGEM